MFKLESYVTPLILSYVDKYIKNLKPEDSQLSLWGGDAVFCNLDLRLDVLEQELQLPFTFVNGHIHELRIHVPWTKLGSEPVVITINTIECILKLHSIKDVSIASKTSKVNRKFVRRQEVSEAPPGYVQSLINRVISNISVVCNNLILKYVEDDIVLSLNIKSAELSSVNDQWEKAFVDINLQDVIVRKIISMQDLTVCLDKRDGSGKIETYQDPLLYRCSTVWRLYSSYNSPRSKYPSVTRIHMFCDKLDFSLTDQQLPMFMRLAKLCLALYYKDIDIYSEKCSSNEECTENILENEEEDSNDLESNIEDESWGSWMWSYVPQVLPVWNEGGEDEEESERETDRQKLEKIFQLGIFIEKASCVLKKTEISQDSSCYGASKFIFSPLAVLHQYGCCMEITVHGKDFVNVQLGITGATITGLGECLCGFKDFSDSSSKMDKAFLKAGVPPGSGHAYSYLSSSLFDPLAPENCGQKRKYCFDREDHLTRLTEEAMVERFPAFAFDYVYDLEIPEEWIDKASSVTSTFLEDSNWRENAVCRVVLGPFCANITSSMVHRILNLLHCAEDHDYPPYSKPKSKKQSLDLLDISAEDIEHFEEFIPMRYYHLTLFKPVLRLFVADHAKYDMQMKSEMKKIKKINKKNEKHMNAMKSNPQPLLLLEASVDCVDLQANMPMYPQRVARIVGSVPSASDNLIYHCYVHHSFKLFGLEANLFNNQQSYQPGATIIPQSSVSFFWKYIILPEFWTNHSDFCFEEQHFECSRLNIQLTEPQLLAVFCICQSWIMKDFSIAALINSPLSNDILQKDKSKISCEILGIEGLRLKTQSVTAYKGTIVSVSIRLESADCMTMIFSAPEDTNDIPKGGAFQEDSSGSEQSKNTAVLEHEHEVWFQFIFQVPKDVHSTIPLILSAKMSGSTLCLEPALLTWLSYDVPTLISDQSTIYSCSTSTSHKGTEDESTCSSQTPAASCSFSMSRSPSVGYCDTVHFYKDVEQLLVDYYSVLKCLVLQVQIKSCCILFPNLPWTIKCFQNRYVICSWKDAIKEGDLTEACVFCFPEVTIQSNAINCNLGTHMGLFITDLPISNIMITNKSQEYFPWTLSVSNFSMYTINNRRHPCSVFFVISPSAASTTLALSSKTNYLQLGLCIHVDTQALNFSCSVSQVQLIMNCLSTIFVCTKFINFMSMWSDYFQQKPAFNGDKNANADIPANDNHNTPSGQQPVEENLEKGKVISEERISDINSSSISSLKLNRKVTLWIQFTLSKLTLNLFGNFASEINSYDFHFQFEAEEVITSLDIQEVYSKMKIKLSSLNINSFLKSDGDLSWSPGPYEGIVLCSNNNLSHCLKSAVIHGSTSRHPKIKVDNQPFLLITYTKALCTNAKKKWTAVSKQNEQIFTDDAKYISEIDMKVKPFDLILWMPVIKVIKETYYPLLSLAILKSQMSKKMKISGSEPKLASFSNRNLPLLYIKSSSVRVFLPKSYLEMQTNKEPDSFVDHIVDSPSRLKPDVLLLQYDCINLTSQVENPLSRIILHSDFFAAAQSARTIGLPGSDVEDRQYQLDVSGLCLGSTVGEEIVKKNRADKEVPRHHPLIMGENPALEWNTGVVNESRKHGDPEPLTLLPIMSPLDIKLAVAPAIICNHPGYQGGLKSIVVAGISLEANVTSDICIYMSIQQIHLLVSVLENNFHLLFPSNLALPDESINLGFSRSKLSEGLRDSGIESETSTRHLSSNLSPDSNKYQSVLTTKASCDNKEFVPFEILVTARSITVMLFAHEDDLIQDTMEKVCVVFKKKNCKSRNEKLDFRDSRYCLPNSGVLENHWNKSLGTSIQTHKRKRKRKKMHADKFLPSSSVLSIDSSNGCKVLGNKDTISLTGSPCEKDEDGYEGSSDSSEYGISKTFEVKKKTKKIYPFLCVSVSQPHSFITCHSSSQKFETSCFDLQFRLGSPSCHVTDLEACSMPVLSDFPESFLETKPGNPDLKTGIPPALYTITCCNFLKEPANVKLRVERPVKFNVGISMWNYSMMFVQSLERKFVGTALNSCDKIPSLVSEEKLKQTESSVSRFFTIISQFGTMEISTMQVVVEVDALPKAKVALLVFGLDNFMLNLDVDSSVYQVQKLQSCLTVSGAVVKTITSGNTWPIIYPLTSTITCKWQLKPWVQVTACVQCETIFLIVGPQQLLSLKPIIDSFTEFLQKELGNQSTEKFISKAEKKGKKVLSGQKHWYDDLRKGAFQFLQDSDGQKEPGVHEIIFSKADDKQPASMTWCYPEPRALTKIDVSPVPFHHSLSKSRKIICHLQYWDSMQHQFLDLCEFELSETVSCSVDLPHLDLNAIAISDVWRVLLDYGYDCDKDNPFENAEGAFLSPLALAACMCVDSYFDINLIPFLKLMVSFERLKINFYNTFAITGCPPKLYPFTFDGVSPVNQEFMLLILDDFTLSCNKWPSKLKIKSVFKIMTEVLEYRSLTMIPVLDPVDINADITVVNGVEKYPIVESEIVVHPCFIKLNQSIVHTLSYSLHSWIEVLTVASPYKHCSEDMLPNYYIICNNIQEKVRFGQINTDESIILASQKMHAYSWRSHKTDQMLRICLECLKWKWSKAFSIDHTGTQMVAVDSTLTLIIKIKALSNLQKQVVIDGHLVVANRLQFPIQLKLSASQQDYTNLNIIRSLPAKSCSSSFVFTLRQYERLCISLLEASNTSLWSEDIELCNSKENQLIKIPWGNKSQYQNVWCRVVEKPLPGNITLTTVLLYPMYVIRNHLPRSLIANVKSCDKDVYLLEIEGRGEEQELFVESSDSNIIQLSFQMSSGMKVSNPPLAISIDNIRHLLNQQNMESDNFEELCYEWRSTHPVTWPYSSFEQLPGSLEFRDTLYSCTSAFPIFPLTKTSEAPNTELKVELSQRWSGLNAILLDVKPWALFLNKLGIDLFLIECGGREWKLAQNSTFVPPPLEEHFKLGIHLDDELFTSIPIKISKTGDCTGQTANINVIPLDGTLHIFIKIKIHRPLLCIFLLKSERCEGIQILTALPLLSITNCTDQDLTLSLYSVLSSLMEVDFPGKGQETIVNKKSDIFVHPLLFWDAVVPFEFQDVGNSALEFFFYLSFSVSGSKSCESSYPICLSPETTVNVRHTLAIPIYSDGDFVTSLPCVVTSHRWNDLIFLTISDDPCPIFLIHNQTNFSLLYGQNCLDSEFYTVCEEKEKHLFLPCIPPGGSVHYSFLTIQDKFPFPFETFPTLRLAHKSNEKLSSHMWSTPIDTSLGNQFICIPEACDVRIFKERVGHTIYLFIEPVNRIELSAKEIRCRIALATEAGSKEFSNSNTVAETSGADSLSGALPKSKCMDNSTTVKKFHGRINQLKVNYSDRDFPFAFCLNIRLIHASVVICDELKSALKVFEVIRLNIDNALLFTRSKVESRSASRINFRHLMQEVSLCFENLQIDNQMDQENSIVFDFPVILKRDSCALQVNKMEASRERAFLPNKIKENSFFIIEAVFEAPFVTDCKLVMRTANVMVQPMSLYLEDALFYKLLQLYKSFVPLQFHQHRPLWRDLYLPKDVAIVSASLTNPFHLEHLKIDIREVYLSIHASLKLYLSLQRSLLRFQPFEKQELFTNFYELGRLLVFHYLTGALFRAGWVVGSLDLLGNPAGFARAIGTGVSDFVLLPYRGLFNGPRAFITGLSHGATALFTQISSGALLCVTNLAASVSRNMDLLSLDAEHLARQELLRRQLPQGLTHGLLQGLNGLGISLLGAIAGIVDHPLQIIVAPSTTIRTATGIVGGLGKGLVGIFTKPIGGAAEFVSQTGHGLLHGAGWLSIHSRQHQPHFVNISERFNSTLKLNCKLVQSAALGEILLVIEAAHHNEFGLFEGDILILTSQVLCVVSLEEDNQQRTFALTEIKCKGSATDQNILIIIPESATSSEIIQETLQVKDRVVEYVQRNWLYNSGELPSSPGTVLNVGNKSSSSAYLTFFIHPKYQSLFIAIFNSSKRKILGKGFPI